MKIAFYTLGCKTNQFEEAMMKQEMQNQGLELVSFNSQADVYVINTCTVTAKTDYQSRQAIRNAVRRRQEAKVVVTGCYAQVNLEAVKSIPGVSLVIGNQEKERIGEYIKNISDENESVSFVGDIFKTNKLKFTEVKKFGERTRAFVKIQDGCNSRCSYCIVPYARGKNRSLESANAVRQVKELVERDYKEIILTGIHLGTYGEDFSDGTSLALLLKKLASVNGNFRVRLSSIEPLEITDELIEAIASSEKICPHLHIPLQSGDDFILKKMSRNYNAGFYQGLIKRIVEKIPEINIGVDVIAGFPGETEEQSMNTYNFIKDLPVGYLHVFPFSKRTGTPAASFKEQLNPNLIKERSKALRELGEKKKSEFRKNFLGKILNVLVEEKKDKEENQYKGFTENYIPVLIQGREEFKNRILPVKLVRIEKDKVFGEAILS